MVEETPTYLKATSVKSQKELSTLSLFGRGRRRRVLNLALNFPLCCVKLLLQHYYSLFGKLTSPPALPVTVRDPGTKAILVVAFCSKSWRLFSPRGFKGKTNVLKGSNWEGERETERESRVFLVFSFYLKLYLGERRERSLFCNLLFLLTAAKTAW